jgi:signal transduction histidine kinase
VFGNKKLLLTTIQNIVSNTYKYSEDHQAFVELVISATEIVVVVKDKGAGIAAEELEHIFQPFYRTEEGASKPGFGLGLPLARRIVQLHKGRVEVRSEPGKGSEFLIRLPHAGHA